MLLLQVHQKKQRTNPRQNLLQVLGHLLVRLPIAVIRQEVIHVHLHEAQEEREVGPDLVIDVQSVPNHVHQVLNLYQLLYMLKI